MTASDLDYPPTYVRRSAERDDVFFVGNSAKRELTCVRPGADLPWSITFGGCEIVTGSPTYLMVAMLLDAFLRHDDGAVAPTFEAGTPYFNAALVKALEVYRVTAVEPGRGLFRLLAAEVGAPDVIGKSH